MVILLTIFYNLLNTIIIYYKEKDYTLNLKNNLKWNRIIKILLLKI